LNLSNLRFLMSPLFLKNLPHPCFHSNRLSPMYP
jgi:hypothetical protein